MIRPFRILAGLLPLALVLPGSASEDGLELEASRGPATEDVTLDWTGGEPLFRIYRSTSPAGLVDPSNLLVEISERTWTDESADLPPGGLYHYKAQGACGNGARESGEECDDGNVVGGDGCSPVCTNEDPVCGDGELNLPGETCDPPGDPAGASGNLCRADCTVCGDGVWDPGFEGCDDGNDNDLDGCRSDCGIPTCGNGIIDQPGETCDPPGEPGGNNGNLCREDCTVCGDAVRDIDEECDDGNGIDDDGCRNNCELPKCGDGMLDPGETCDPPGDPAGASGNVCRAECTVCGDGIQHAGEECDDGNGSNLDGCRNDCSLPICGDGILDPGETCDPPGEPAGQPNQCRDDCSFCGDGVLAPGEECDDGNNEPGDGCTPTCEFCTGMIGDFVWNDGKVGRECDGIQPGDGTRGINGVTVRLLDAGGFVLQEQLTHVGPGGMDGHYKFGGLCAGDYTVEVLPPAGFLPAPSIVGDPAGDSNGSPAGVNLPADESMDLTIDFGFCTEAGEQGCTPGYWKVPRHHDSWIPTGYTTGQPVAGVFVEAGAYPEGAASLVEALGFPGGPRVRGAVRILLRAATAALLNASHPDVDSTWSEWGVIERVNDALASGDRDTMLELADDLDDDNNLGCPLD